MSPIDPAAERHALLDRMRLAADPLADQTIARIVGPWAAAPEAASAEALLALHGAHWQRLQAATRAFSQWTTNADLQAWRPGPELPAEVAQPLLDFLERARQLPAWADAAQIRRAEKIFFDHGPLSCTLLFCASLPECYVVPDLAEVLHATGQLERHTEHRIRATAAMIFPVMMRGGLTQPEGSGVAQVLKVRLIHATIRNLLLHASPQQALSALALLGPEQRAAGAATVAPSAALHGVQQMHQALYAHGWRLDEDGLPCNQEELAYTLLTFGYVFARGMRSLGVGLAGEDEAATLHAWNVVGHLVGVRDELMVHDMAQAADWFALLQARGRAHPVLPDPRPALGRTLMQTMARTIPWAPARPFPVLLARVLCSAASTRDIGLDRRSMAVPWRSRLVFMLLLVAVRVVDALARRLVPSFSLSRFFTRLLGYRLVSGLLMDQTRPLKLPEPVRAQLQGTVSHWGDDPRAPRWLNALEDRFTVPGGWHATPR
jgi:hypothetical protein